MNWFLRFFSRAVDEVADLPSLVMSKCQGKCYCGKACVLDHELAARRCTCDGNHNMCKEYCPHANLCWAIARHKGNHECKLCFQNEMTERQNEINRKYQL